MNHHNQAVETINKLFPKIQEHGEQALLDYAESNDLPPAQLEKLARVCNTMATISYIDNAPTDSRGDTKTLIDVPTLVTGYATGLSQEKRAKTPSSVETHNAATVDLTKHLMLDMGILRKAASTKTADPIKPRVVFTRDDMDSALYELQYETRVEMGKQASQLVNALRTEDSRVLDMNDTLEEASRTIGIQATEDTLTWFQKHASALRLELSYDLEELKGAELKKRAFEVSHATGDLFQALSKSILIHTELEKMAVDATAIEKAINGEDTATAPAEEQDDYDDADDDNDDDNASVGSGKGGEDPPTENTTSGEDDKPSNKKTTPKDREPTKAVRDEEKLRLDENKKEKGEGMTIHDSPLVRAAESMSNSISKLTSKERQNKAQMSTDASVADIKRSINLRRMIAQDPVLKESDPRDVLEAYNSAVQVNPELADNMYAMKLLLRESVSYEGHTLDTIKQLADVRKSLASTSKDEAENKRRDYAVGGANPLDLLTSKAKV